MMSGGSLSAAMQRLVYRLLERRANRQRENDEIPGKQVKRKNKKSHAFTPKSVACRGASCFRKAPKRPFDFATILKDVSVSDPADASDGGVKVITDGVDIVPNESSETPLASQQSGVDIASNEEEEEWVGESKNVELVGLLVWGITLSAFILYNNFVEPWPMPQMVEVPIRFWRITHVVSAMLFGGGIILTTGIEWLVASNENPPVLQFWFDKVPLLDAVVVLPALTISVISGTGLAIENYGGLGDAPVHISITFYCLVAFATWWAVTDLTSQGKALQEVNEWVIASTDDNTQEIPKIVKQRRISNVVSCLFVVALYAIMILKPGVIYWKEHFGN